MLNGSYGDFIEAYKIIENTLRLDYERKKSKDSDPRDETPAVTYPTFEVILDKVNQFLWFCQNYEVKSKAILEEHLKSGKK